MKALVALMVVVGPLAAVADIFESTGPPNMLQNETFMGTNIRLKQKLFTKYNPELRSVKDSLSRTDVKLSVAVTHLETIDEVQQRMRVNGFISMVWNDEFLIWNKDEYGGQDYIDTNQFRLWNIFRASGKDDFYHISWRVPVRIFSSGQVYLWSPVSFDVTCDFDFTNFPYDRQSCGVSFGSIFYTRSQVDFQWGKKTPASQKLSFRGDKRHLSGWEILSLSTAKMFLNQFGRMNQSSNTTTEWPELILQVSMQRHSPYFRLLFVLPAIIAALLTLFSLCLRNAEVSATILMRSLIIQALFLRGLITILPLASGDTPKIVIFYGFNVAMTIIATLLVILRSLIDPKSNRPLNAKISVVTKFVDQHISPLMPYRKAEPSTTQTELDQTAYLSFASVYLFSYFVAIAYLFS